MAEEKNKKAEEGEINLGPIGGLIGMMMLFMMVGMMQAAPPIVPPNLPYCCPYCGQCFATYDELVAHVQAQHPSERIPIEVIWS